MSIKSKGETSARRLSRLIPPLRACEQLAGRAVSEIEAKAKEARNAHARFQEPRYRDWNPETLEWAAASAATLRDSAKLTRAIEDMESASRSLANLAKMLRREVESQ